MPYVPFEDLLANLEQDPWRTIEQGRSQYKSSRRRLWELAAFAFAFAMHIDDQPEMIEYFYKLPFWQGGNERDPTKLLLHVLQYMMADRFAEDSDRAQTQASAMQGAFDTNWTAQDVLAGLIEHNGFAPFKRWWASQQPVSNDAPAAAMLIASASEATAEGDDPFSDLADMPVAAPAGGHGGVRVLAGPGLGKPGEQPRRGGKRAGPGTSRYTRSWCMRQLILSLDETDLHGAFGLQRSDEATVTFQRAGEEEDGFKLFEVVSFDIKRRRPH